MKSTFKIFPDKKLIIETLSSDITTDEYIRLKHDEFHHKKFNRHFNLVTDFRLCEENFGDIDLQEMVNIFRENKGKFHRKKSALIISNIKRITQITLNKRNNTGSPHEIKYFMNLENAENWAEN